MAASRGGNIRTAYPLSRRSGRFRRRIAADDRRRRHRDRRDPAGNADQQTNPDNPFFGSRPPLVATFKFNGEEVTIVNNHFTSKGGSGALYRLGSSRRSTPSEVQRAAQAQAVNNFVDNLLGSRSGRQGHRGRRPQRVPVRGADAACSRATATITNYDVPGSDPFDATATYTPGGTAVLHDLQDTLPANEQYDYVFDGNAQTLDHMLVSDNLAAGGAVRRRAHQRGIRRPDQRPRSAGRELRPCRATNYTLQLLHLSDGEGGTVDVEDGADPGGADRRVRRRYRQHADPRGRRRFHAGSVPRRGSRSIAQFKRRIHGTSRRDRRSAAPISQSSTRSGSRRRRSAITNGTSVRRPCRGAFVPSGALGRCAVPVSVGQSRFLR